MVIFRSRFSIFLFFLLSSFFFFFLLFSSFLFFSLLFSLLFSCFSYLFCVEMEDVNKKKLVQSKSSLASTNYLKRYIFIVSPIVIHKEKDIRWSICTPLVHKDSEKQFHW